MGRALTLEAVSDDVPLRLDVAARLAFPDGSITPEELKRAIREGRLHIYVIAGKTMTTLRHLREMTPGAVIPPPVEGKGYLYVVGFGPYVKIGRSRSAEGLQRRINALRTSAPETLVVYAFLTGTGWDERKLHQRFAKSRLQGEWFRLEDHTELSCWIRQGCPL